MSSLSDDIAAEFAMTDTAHRALEQVDPQNRWLQYYDRETETIQDVALAKEIWTKQWEYGSARRDLLRLHFAYRAVLKVVTALHAGRTYPVA